MKRIKILKLFMVLLLCGISLFATGCSVSFEWDNLRRGDLIRVSLIDGEDSKMVYLANMQENQQIDTPTKDGVCFLGYFAEDVCYIDFNGRVVSYYLDNFPRTLYAKYTDANNQYYIFEKESQEVANLESSITLIDSAFNIDNACKINIYYTFMLKENQSNWADYSFVFVNGDDLPISDVVTLQENDTTSNVCNTSYFGILSVDVDLIIGNVIGCKVTRLEETSFEDYITDFTMIIELVVNE